MAALDHRKISFTFGLVLGLLLPGTAMSEPLSFADIAVGTTPPAFESALTGRGRVGRWEIAADATAAGGKALTQLDADPIDERYPLAIYRPPTPVNVAVTVRFKPLSGKVDQAGGIAVRLLDAKNYYLARANALEDNVRFYRVVNGRRQQLASADTKVAPGAWHTLALRAEGDRFTVAFDGAQVLATRDTTFKMPGRIALWTKADSVTAFDGIIIEPLP